jgi:hypothetical protein
MISMNSFFRDSSSNWKKTIKGRKMWFKKEIPKRNVNLKVKLIGYFF